jgi:hypothetical protein
MLPETILSLGNQPLSNGLPLIGDGDAIDKFPLDFKICGSCGLGQIGEYVAPEIIFGDYTYFSSTSSSWVLHARNFALNMMQQISLKENDFILEIASNDGYLLKHFQEFGCRVLGIEPARNVAEMAISSGIPTETDFFGEKKALELVQRGLLPKLVICNNVVAHVPDLIDFMKGLAILAAQGSLISIEAPSMLRMLEKNLFDTIYHEHFSYLNTFTLDALCNQNQLKLVKVEKLSTHGGSNRYWLADKKAQSLDGSVKFAIEHELQSGLLAEGLHKMFADSSRNAISVFGTWCRSQKEPIVGYGAAAKATVLLNAAEIKNTEVVAVGDNAKSKQGKMIPGVNIPIFSPKEAFSSAEKSLVIFPWNIAQEISQQIRRDFPRFEGELWVPLPEMKLID